MITTKQFAGAHQIGLLLTMIQLHSIESNLHYYIKKQFTAAFTK